MKGATIEETFKHGDKVYILSALTTRDRADLQTYVRFRSYHLAYNARSQFPDSISSRLDRLFDDCAKRKVTVGEVDEVLHEEDGAAFLLYLSLRKKQPDLTKEDVTDLADSFPSELSEDIASKLVLINGWNKSPDPTTAQDPKK